MAREGIYEVPGKYVTRWRAVVDVGRNPITGKRQQRSRTFDTEQEAHDWRINQLHTLRSGTYLEPSSETLATFLPRWLQSRATLEASSLNLYRRTMEHHIIPYLGAVELGDLRPEHIEQLQATLRRTGLAPHTVNGAVQLLSQALKRAVIWRLIAVNPCTAVEGLPEPKRQRAVWSLRQLRAFLAGTADEPLGALWQVAAVCGLRRGELLALRWQDIDFDESLVRVVRGVTEDEQRRIVFGDPKTDAGQRVMGLPPSVATALKRHRANQHERRLQAGSSWQDHDLIFDRGDGGRLSFNAYSLAFHRARKRLELPAIRPHDLRHRAATLMMNDAGVPLSVVSQLLGHAGIGITADTYGHLTDEIRREVAQRVDAALWGSTGS